MHSLITPQLAAGFFVEEEKDGGGSRSNGKILMVVVKGDVHNIGKNIVGVVL